MDDIDHHGKISNTAKRNNQLIRSQAELLQDLSSNTKYRVLGRSLIGLAIALAIVIFINFQLAKNITSDTEHMDIIGEISDLMFEVAADTQQLSLTDGTNSEQANQLIKQLQDETKKVDDYLEQLQGYSQEETQLATFKQQWQAYRSKILALQLQKFGEVGNISERTELAKYAYQQKKSMYDLLADGYDVYLQKTYQYGRYVRILQVLTLVGLVGFLLFFVNYAFRRMRVADAQIQAAQQQTQDIMATVNEGLFLIDKVFCQVRTIIASEKYRRT